MSGPRQPWRRHPWHAAAGLLAMFALGLSVSCSPEEKHKVLTFLFDGVPPLDAEKKEPDKKAPEKAPTKVEEAKEPTEPEPTWYVHQPSTDQALCRACHDPDRSFALRKPKNELCGDCHEAATTEYPHMHGPVAVGHCATCHAAHRSRYEHVLRAPAPELCFQCHRASEPGQTLGCPRESNETDCTTCHHGHGGENAYFLVSRPSQEKKLVQPPSPPSGKAE